MEVWGGVGRQIVVEARAQGVHKGAWRRTGRSARFTVNGHRERHAVPYKFDAPEGSSQDVPSVRLEAQPCEFVITCTARKTPASNSTTIRQYTIHRSMAAKPRISASRPLDVDV